MVFYKLLLQLLSYGTILAVKRQTWCGTALTCWDMKHLCGALGDTTYSLTRHTAAKSYPFGSFALHLVPVEHLRNLIAAHPAAVEVECSGAGLPCQRQASLLASTLSLLKGINVRAFSSRAVLFDIVL